MPRLEKIESEKWNFHYFWKIYQYVWVEAAIEQFLGQLDHPSVFHYRLNSFILLTQQMGDERHGTVALWHCGTVTLTLQNLIENQFSCLLPLLFY